MKGINCIKIAAALKDKKVLSRAHVCSLEQIARNTHDHNGQTTINELTKSGYCE